MCAGVKFENAVEESDVVGSFEFWRDLSVCIVLVILAGAFSI